MRESLCPPPSNGVKSYRHGRPQQHTHLAEDPFRRPRRRPPNFALNITRENFREHRGNRLTLSIMGRWS
jgi:hypothetical protein